VRTVGPERAGEAALQARREHVLRLGSWGVLGAASVITLLGVVLVMGAFRNDQLIAENHGTPGRMGTVSPLPLMVRALGVCSSKSNIICRVEPPSCEGRFSQVPS